MWVFSQKAFFDLIKPKFTQVKMYSYLLASLELLNPVGNTPRQEQLVKNL